MMNRPKKDLGYILVAFPKLSETFILNEILELEKRGFRINIFSLFSIKEEKMHSGVSKIKGDIVYAGSSFSSKVIISNVYFLLRSPLRYLRLLRLNLKADLRDNLSLFTRAVYFAKLLVRDRCEHLHAHFATSASLTAEIISELVNIPFSLTVHAGDIFEEKLPQLIEKAKFVRCISQYGKKYLTRICRNKDKEKIKLIHCGIDLERFKRRVYSESQTILTILSVGRLVEKKGLIYLLKASRMLTEKGYSFQCEIVGEGPARVLLEEMVKKYELAKQVHLIGPLSQDEVIEYYEKGDIFVLPSVITDDGDRDGIPVTLMEAMAMEIPVVSTEMETIKELIDDKKTGLLVPPRDEKELSCAIELLLKNPQLRKKLGTLAREKVMKEFNIEESSKLLSELFLAEEPRAFDNAG